jgi:hypothetical protein
MARPLKYDTEKKERKLRVTDIGWDGVKNVARQENCPGIADVLEKLGRGELVLSHPKPDRPDPEEAIAQVLRTVPPRERSTVSRYLRKLVALL